MSMTFTYRYSAQVTKQFQYHKLWNVLGSWGENSPFLPFHLFALLGKSSRLLQVISVPKQRPGFLSVITTLCSSALVCALGQRSHFPEALSMSCPCICSLGMAQPILKRECVRDERCETSPVSHTPLPLSSSCPTSACSSSTLFLHQEWLSSVVLSIDRKMGGCLVPVEQSGWIVFSSSP